MTASPSRLGRVGLVVPKYKRTGVERNRLKRRLRELVRTRLLPTLPPVDLVIRAMPHAYEAAFEALAADVARAGERIPAFPSQSLPAEGTPPADATETDTTATDTPAPETA